MHNTDILIAGGGTPGLTLAILLAQAGLRVDVVDPMPSTANQTDSRTSALMQDSLATLTATGALETCRAQGGVMRALKIIDDKLAVTFEASEIGQEFFGINFPNTILRAALLERAKSIAAIKLHLGKKLLSHTVDAFGVTAQIENDNPIRARLIVGADGRHSTVRENVGIHTTTHAYGQQAITCLLNHTLPHHETSTEFHRPSGPFTLVPLPGNHASLVWVDFDAEIEKFIRLDKNSFRQAMQDRSNGILGELTIETPPQAWPLIRLKAAHLTAPRTALIAEAAHVLHPLGAQGLNLSLRDAAALAATIIDAVQLGQDPGSAATLTAYSAHRKQDVDARLFGTDLLNKLVSTRAPFAASLRRLGLKTLNEVSLLRDLAMRHGMA